MGLLAGVWVSSQLQAEGSLLDPAYRYHTGSRVKLNYFKDFSASVQVAAVAEFG